MSLQVIGADGRLGKVVVVDQRADGSVIVLLCEPFAPTSPGVIIPTQQTPEKDPGGFPWPVERYRDTIALESTPFVMNVDVTEMPAEPLPFETDAFLRATTDAADRGATTVHLTTENASSWGWRPPRTEESQR